MGTVWLIASGKGGAGKSTCAAGCAAALAETGAQVCVVDTDLGLRGQDLLMGVQDQVVYDLLDVTCKGCDLRQALVPVAGREGLFLLAASQFARARDLDPKALRRVLKTLRDRFDIVLIDAPAGMEKGLRTLMNAEPDETVLVVNPDDICLRDAERVAGLFASREMPRPRVLVNRLRPELVRSGEMLSARQIADVLELPLLGEIPEDSMVVRAALRHVLLMDVACPAREAFLRIARRMKGETVPFPEYGSGKIRLRDRLLRRVPKEVPLIDR